MQRTHRRLPLALLRLQTPSVLFVNQHYWPDFASTGQHLTDLAEHVAGEGVEVHVLCSRGKYLAGALPVAKREDHNGVAIRRVGATSFGRGTNVGRLIDYATFYAKALTHVVFGRRYDQVVVLTTPPLLGAMGAVARTVRGARYGIWSMDLHPDAEEALGMLRPTQWRTRFLHAVNGWGYRRADFVVDLGYVMKRRLAAKGVEPERLHTIPVWSAKEDISPVAPEDNPLRKELGLEGKFVVMYSGNAGLAHRFEEVKKAMLLLKDHPSVHFLFVGSGPRRADLEAFAAENGLANFSYLNYFDRDQLAYSLSLGDVHLLTLRDDMAGIAVPGKLYGIMAAGRPTIMVGPSDSEPAQTILTEEVGYVFPPEGDSGQRLADTIRDLAEKPATGALMGDRARAAFLAHFEREGCCSQWADLLASRLHQSAREQTVRSNSQSETSVRHAPSHALPSSS